MTKRTTEDLADALALLMKATGEYTLEGLKDEAKGDEPFNSRPHTERIIRVIERIEADAFKRGVEAQRDYAMENVRAHFTALRDRI